jgi:hypothetical protein
MIGALSTPHLMSIKFFRDRRNGLDLVQQEQAQYSGAMPRPPTSLETFAAAITIRGLGTARYAVLVAGCVHRKPHPY